MRSLVILITVAVLFALPEASLADSKKLDSGTGSKARKEPDHSHLLRITLKDGTRIEGTWFTRRGDTVAIHDGRWRWIPNSEIKDIKDLSKPGFFKKVWLKVWPALAVPVVIAEAPVWIVVTL